MKKAEDFWLGVHMLLFGVFELGESGANNKKYNPLKGNLAPGQDHSPNLRNNRSKALRDRHRSSLTSRSTAL